VTVFYGGGWLMGRVRREKATITLNTNDLRLLTQIRDELGLASIADTVRTLIHLYVELHNLGINPLAAPELLKTYESINKKLDEITELIKLIKPVKEVKKIEAKEVIPG
jgi:pantothenate kinase